MGLEVMAPSGSLVLRAAHTPTLLHAQHESKERVSYAKYCTPCLSRVPPLLLNSGANGDRTCPNLLQPNAINVPIIPIC